jgi:hypothetical protein
VCRVSFETSFDMKQPKLEPKLVSALSETKRLFGLFRFYTKTESFGVLIEPKQTEEQQKQFDTEHILVFLQNILGCFETVCFGCFASIPKQGISKFRLNKQKNNRNRSCFDLFRFEPTIFLFVSRTP